jgi:hypothetical protein
MSIDHHLGSGTKELERNERRWRAMAYAMQKSLVNHTTAHLNGRVLTGVIIICNN